MMDPQIAAFAALAAVLTVTPGPDTMLVVRNVLARGRWAGLITTAGICSGLFVHAALSALGVSAILMHSAGAFQALKLLGGGYLMVLGVQSIWRAARRRGLEEAIVPGKTRDEGGGAQPRVPRLRSFLEGFLTNLLNPKVALFYLAVLPQFIAASDPVLLKSFLLAGIHWMMGIVWLGLVAVFLGRVDAIFNHPALRRVLEATSGTLLVALGLRLALERR